MQGQSCRELPRSEGDRETEQRDQREGCTDLTSGCYQATPERQGRAGVGGTLLWLLIRLAPNQP